MCWTGSNRAVSSSHDIAGCLKKLKNIQGDIIWQTMDYVTRTGFFILYRDYFMPGKKNEKRRSRI